MKLIDYTVRRRPWVSTGLAVAGTALGLALIFTEVWRDYFESHGDATLFALVLFVAAFVCAVIAAFGWHPAGRAYLEIDVPGRRLVRHWVHSSVSQMAVVRFDEIRALGVVAGILEVTTHTYGPGVPSSTKKHDEGIFHVIALPSGEKLFAARTQLEASRVAKRIAGVVGVPVHG